MSVIGKPKSSLDTPCLVIDKNILQNNIKKLQQEVVLAKKQVRPHVKTHKCTSICKLQINAGAIGISAAKVSEALVLAESGFINTLITSPVVTPNKIEKLMLCLQQDPGLMVVVDNLENIKALNDAVKYHNKTLNVLIDIDPNVGRTGIPYHEVVDFAKAMKGFSNLRLQGIQCYAGNLQHIVDYTARRKASSEVMLKAANVIKQLNEAGFYCPILSGSGTGTYDVDLKIPEITEVQPGSYTVMDTEYLKIGSEENPTHYTKFKSAMTLLTTVISVNHGQSVTCDAGWKALYEVPTKPLILQPTGCEYDWFGDEHGKITAQDPTNLPKLGDQLELIVAHCDPTINLYDVFYVTEDNTVTDVWLINMRGKSQ